MVRLKVLENGFKTMLGRFQFQYGTIKSWQGVLMIDDFGMFQFQYGTIKRIS